MIAKLELNSSEKMLLCSGDTATTYKLLDISLEHDAIFDEPYVTTIGELYAGTNSISYTKLTSIYHHTLSKRDITWMIDVNNLSVWSLRGLLLLFLDEGDDLAHKNEEFCNPSMKNILAIINAVSNPLFAACQQVSNIHPELKKCFYKGHSM